ncbi:MAG: hypothetical protein NTV21_17370 [Planctomycetota bacterium]|nr:hypothetical protein [Planctomycetota bacterium]
MPTDDLLKPSLDDRFDVSRLRSPTASRPWDPERLKFAAFFCWPIGAGALFATNYRRLGQPRAANWTWAGTVVLSIAFLATAVYLAFLQSPGTKVPTKFGKYVFMAIAMGCAFGIAKHQSGPYRAFETSGGEPPRLWPWVVGGLAANVLVLGGVLIGAAVYLRDEE